MLTDCQHKVLARITQGARMHNLSTYECRSLEPLRREGLIRFVTCGECSACRCGGKCQLFDVEPVQAAPSAQAHIVGRVAYLTSTAKYCGVDVGVILDWEGDPRLPVGHSHREPRWRITSGQWSGTVVSEKQLDFRI